MARTVRLESLDDPRLDAYARLTEHQLRSRLEPERAMLVAESRNVIDVALAQGLEPLSFLVDESHLSSAADLFARAPEEVPVFVLPQEQLERLCGFKVTRGLLACFRRPAERGVAELLDGARNVVVLEDLVDVTNVGALFRSAAALGADAVLLSPRCADPLCRRAVRVSMGTVFQVPWTRVEAGAWPAACADELRGRGFSLSALALTDDALPIDAPGLGARLGEKRALFFGCEGWGLTKATLAACDQALIIPMARGVDSLNVAASSAVAFWQLFQTRGRHQTGGRC